MNLQTNMSEPSLLNGLPPPNFGKNSAMSNVPLNGVDSSPVHRVHQIPVSQLPPIRSSIPSSQLPPISSSNVQENLKQITQNYGHLNISQVTPISSPKAQNFSTSTPLLPQKNSSDSPIREYSPVPNSVGNNSGRTNSHVESKLETVQLTANIKNLNRQNHENNNLEQSNQLNSKPETSRSNEVTKNVNLPYSAENVSDLLFTSRKSAPNATFQPIQRSQQQVQQLGLKQGVPEGLKQTPNFPTMSSNVTQKHPQDFDLMAPTTPAFHQKREEQQIPNFQGQNSKVPQAYQQQNVQKREELQNFSYFQGQSQAGGPQFNLQQQLQPRPQLVNQKSAHVSNQKQEVPPVLQPTSFQTNLKPTVPIFPHNQNAPPPQSQFSQPPRPQQAAPQFSNFPVSQSQPQQGLKQAPPQFSNFPVPQSQPQQELKQTPTPQFSNFPVLQSQPQQEVKQAPPPQFSSFPVSQFQPQQELKQAPPPQFSNFPVSQSQPQQEVKQAPPPQFSNFSVSQSQPQQEVKQAPPPQFSNFPVSQSQPQQEVKQAPPPQFSNFPVPQSQPQQELKQAPPPQFSNFPAAQLQPHHPNLPQNVPKQPPPVLQQQQQNYPFQYSPQNHGQTSQPPPLLTIPLQTQGPPKIPNLQQQLPQKQEVPAVYQPPQQISDSTSTTYKTNLHANRYPSFQPQQTNPQGQFSNNLLQPQQQHPIQHNVLPNQPANQPNNYANYNKSEVVQSGFSKMWGHDNIDLLQCPTVLPPFKIDPPRVTLGQEFLDAANCSPDIFRCTMTKIPETSTLLQKSRLPLGVLIHPFKDLDHLPVIQCSTIVRCRACRTYINPFVFFIDMKRWKCNLCYRVNELPEEFQFDPVSKTYGDPSRRPEIKSSTIEYIAPSEYMLRPPQPAVYIYLLDVSRAAIDSGYLHSFCSVLKANLDSVPGDGRTQVGFIAFNSAIHFYSFGDGLSRPHEMTMLDIDDIFLPCPDNLVVNLNEHKELITDLLTQLPDRFINSYDTGSALGAALQIGHKLISNTGGRITVFQSGLPNCGPGKLIPREDPNQRSGSDIQHLNPANDFYKRLALDCSGQQIAVDLFVLNSQYVDLATISGISKFSGGSIHHYPLFKTSRVVQVENFERCLKRYLIRKIGFEAVMRVRCTRGLSIHTFHGNFFVRSTDLLSLPNVNPEAGFGMQVSIDESLSDLHTVCFQAALLYTSSKGERRIRVHTLCLPIANNLPDVLAAADQQCIIGLLAKMAVDRSVQSSLADSREAFINVAVDILSSYKLSLNLGNNPAALVASHCLQLLPLYISALLKHLAFRTGISTRLDDRVKAMCDMKTLPLYLLIQQIYPDLYPVHNLEDQNTTLNVEGEAVPQPGRLQLSARCLDSKSAFLLDMGENMILLVCPNVSGSFLKDALGVPDYNSISEQMYDLPILNTPQNLRLNNFINSLNDEKPFPASLHIMRENSQHRHMFIERLIEDRIETALSYHEFLQHLKTQVK